jgi:SAM-dependent methyltransferase
MSERASPERLQSVYRAAAILYRSGASHVWIFGSLTSERAHDRESDVDLAVEGVPLALLRPAVEEARREVGGRVDVVPLETAPASLRSAILGERALVPRAEPAYGYGDGRGTAGEATPARNRIRTLAESRIDAVADELDRCGAQSVLDLGCGFGRLLERLASGTGFERLTGVDRSEHALDAASRRFRKVLTPSQQARVRLVRDLITYRNPAYLGHDAAVAMEVIEHFDPAPRAAFESVLFDFVRAATVIVTTPNVEYNAKWRLNSRNGLRTDGHRFEWTRGELEGWAATVARRHGYAKLVVAGVGPADPTLGAPTQLVVFSEPATAAQDELGRRAPA